MVEEEKAFVKENPMNGEQKDNVARALDCSIIPYWWHDSRAGSSSKGKKQAKINKRIVADNVVENVRPERSVLYSLWQGTAAGESFFDMVTAAVASVALSVAWASSVAKDDCDSWKTGCSSRPLWTTHLYSLHHYFKFLLVLSAFLVALRLLHSFNRYRRFYSAARNLQGAITDLALCVGTATSANRLSAGFEITFERYLNLLHTVVYLEKRRSPQLCQLLSIDDLHRADVLGLHLLNSEEYRSLKNAQRTTACQLPDLIMGWLSASFNKAMYDNLFRVDLTQERALALNVSFQNNMEKLQEVIWTLTSLFDQPLPMMLMQYVVHLVDTVCFVVAPVFFTVEVNTFVLEAGRWEASSFWNAVCTTAVAAVLMAFVLQGGMRVAEALESPLGKPDGQLLMQHSPTQQGARCLIDIPVILKQTRMATFTMFNTRRGIQRPNFLAKT